MRKRLILSFFALVFLIGGVWSFINLNLGTSGPPLSSDQQLIRDNLGVPDQFVVTYLPREGGKGNQLARFEIWYYREAGKKLSFLAGVLTDSADYALPPDTPSTGLFPEDVDYSQNYTGVASLLDPKAIVPLEFDPTQTYSSPEALFVMENDHLTYFQTLYAPNP